ncbi:Hypothetical predicted protein [Marmota monax]|uniref:Uncharacterized protein n=1 Tax=Marmota monax TaxID=9995 RepID=A0A5E4BEM6_MARMO|nr:Hypothetical predicted protein [Marmota monax]
MEDFAPASVTETLVTSRRLAFGSAGLCARRADARGAVGVWPGCARGPRRAPPPPESSHNAALASQFRYTVSPGAGGRPRRGRGSRAAAAVTRAPGRGGRPRAAPLARSARDPAKGRSRPAARLRPARPPARPLAQRHQPRERAGRRLGRLHAALFLAKPRPHARTPAARRRRRWGRLLLARSRTRHPRGWRPHSPSRPRRCAERARRGAGASRRCGTRAGGTPAGRRGDWHWAAAGLRAPPCPQRRRVPSRRPACGSGAVAKLSACVDPPRISAWCCAVPFLKTTSYWLWLRDSYVLSLCLLCVLEARHDLTL